VHTAAAYIPTVDSIRNLINHRKQRLPSGFRRHSRGCFLSQRRRVPPFNRSYCSSQELLGDSHCAQSIGTQRAESFFHLCAAKQQQIFLCANFFFLAECVVFRWLRRPTLALIRWIFAELSKVWNRRWPLGCLLAALSTKHWLNVFAESRFVSFYIISP